MDKSEEQSEVVENSEDGVSLFLDLFGERVKRVMEQDESEEARVCHPGVLGSSVRKRLKRKEMAKTLESSVRKRIERKELGKFSGGRRSGGMPEGVQETSY